MIDLYRNDDGVVTKQFPGLSAGSHTISVTVIGNDDVYIDYVDAWDGTALPDGTFEAFPDDRFYLSSGWSRITNGSANNGSYLRASSGNAWFPFTGCNQSFFGEVHMQGSEGLQFYTRQKVTMTRWISSPKDSHQDPIWSAQQGKKGS